MTRYWLIQIDFEYIVNNGGGCTTLKTKAGRLRDEYRQEMEKYLSDAGITSITFVPTTYKPAKSEFIDPLIWWWCNRPSDDLGIARGNRKGWL